LAGEQAMVLTLPESVPSQLRLSVPVGDLVARTADPMTAVAVIPAGEGTATITAGGLGRRLELFWRPKLKATGGVAPVLEATGLLVVDVDGETVGTQATLLVKSLQGPFAQFHVQVPAETELPREGSPNGARFEFLARPEGGKLLQVQLDEPTSDPFPVSLVTRRSAPRSGGPLRIEGFSVVEAVRQTGQIAVRREGDWSVRSVVSRGAHRVDVASLQVSLRSAYVLAGFEYARQPFQLELELRPVEPRVTAQPRYTLVIEPGRVTAAGTFDFLVERGGLLGAQIVVPAGWEVDEVGPASLIDPGERVPAGQERLNLQFLARTSDRFQVELRAHRNFEVGAGPLEVALPLPVAGDVLPVHLAVVAAADVELSPQFEAMPGLVPGVANRLEAFYPLPDLPPFRRAPLFFRVDADKARFRADVAVQPQRLEVESQANVTIDGVRASIEQTLSYDVANAPVTELALLVPQAAYDSITVRPEQGTTAFLKRAPDAAGAGSGEWRAVLGQQRIGRIELALSYRIPAGVVRASTHSKLAVPLVMPAAGDLNANRVTVVVPSTMAVELDDPDWWQATSGLMFEATKPASRLNLVLQGRERLPSPPLIISRAWIRIGIGANGSQQYRGHYRLTTREAEVVLQIPPDFEPSSFRFQVDGIPVDALEQSDGTVRIELSPDSEGPNRVLTAFARRQEDPRHSRRGRRGVFAPLLFPEGTLIEQTYWQVHLPTNEYLVAGSKEVTDEWNWRRVGLTWVRFPARSESDLASWIGGSAAQEAGGYSLRGNVYLFGQAGALAQLDLVTTTPPVLILVASGSVFLLGILPLYFRFARTALLWLALGTALALVGVAYPGAAVLFLQSAVLGASLVVVAGAIKTVLDRRHRGVVLPTDAPSSVSTFASTLSQLPRAPRSEAPTASIVAGGAEDEPEPNP
jgi:hypothetical protein